MKDYARLARPAVCVITVALASTLTAGIAHAQAAPPPADTPPPPPPAAAAPPAPAPPMPMPPPPPATPPAAVAAETKPPTATEAMPATRPDVLPPIDVGAWVRASSIFQGTNPSKINDWHMDSAYVELHTGGKITKNVGVTLNLNGNAANYGTSGGSTSAGVEDAIIAFDFMPEFHLWAGHLLVMVDRSNSSGPFFMLPWNFPGNFANPGTSIFAAAPYEGPFGRNNGAVIWGDIQGGLFSYFAGVYDNGNVASSPLFSGKLRLALWDPEPGFWGNGSYFGGKDILSFDLGAQAQAHGSVAGDKTYADVNVDALVEKKMGAGSYVSGQGAYYHYNQDDGAISDTFFLLAAYATPTVGVGNIQPMIRYQWEKVKNTPGTSPWNLDVAVSYLIKGPALRAVATYSHTGFGSLAAAGGPTSSNSIQLSAQAIFF
jgi:hypothetical protein